MRHPAEDMNDYGKAMVRILCAIITREGKSLSSDGLSDYHIDKAEQSHAQGCS